MPKSEDGQYELILENRQVLMIFFVAAALCGVFFGLGYVVGKNSGSGFVAPPQTAAPSTSAEGKRSALSPAETPAATAPVTSQPEVKAEPPKEPPTTAPVSKDPEKKQEVPVAEKKEAPAPPPPAPVTDAVITLQVAALSKRDDADAMVALLKRKSFPVTLVTNAPDNLFRVQVGPYSSVKDAEAVKVRLEREGFKPIVKK